jgi:hypothetical protein
VRRGFSALEPCAGKLACTVLRGGGDSNVSLLTRPHEVSGRRPDSCLAFRFAYNGEVLEDLTMVSVELLNHLRALNRAEKLHVLQVLVSELAQEEATLLRPGLAYPVWSPYDAHEAADTMLKLLKSTEPVDHAQR